MIFERMHGAVANRRWVAGTIRKVIVDLRLRDLALNKPRCKFELFRTRKWSPCGFAQITVFLLIPLHISHGFPGAPIVLCRLVTR